MPGIVIFLMIVTASLGVLAIWICFVEDPNYRKRKPQQQYEQNVYQEAISYETGYQRRFLLTSNEYHAYKKLKIEADKRNLLICPKVRILDIIEPRPGHKDFQTLLRKIQSKHVDFVICDKNLYVRGIIELDDGSHYYPDRRERDEFVNTVLRSCGYTVIRTYAITEHTLDSFIDIDEQ